MTTSLLLALLVSQAPAARVYALDAARSAVAFHLDHALHAVDGRAQALEAKAVLAPDGELKAMARAQVARLDTGDANRDANLRLAMEADKHPYVVLKGTSRIDLPAALPATVPLKLAAEIDAHGVKRPAEIPLTAEFDAAGGVRVRGRFAVSLDAHGIERPSLLFRKVDDACRVDVDLVFVPEAR